MGDVITILPEKITDDEGNEKELLKNNQVKIVGTVRSPLYISRDRGTSKLGAGKVNYYLYLPKESINSDIYTSIYLTVEGAKELSSFDKKYEDVVKEVKDKIEEISDKRREERYNEILEPAQTKITDAEKTLEEEKKKAEEKIADAQRQIDEAKKELENAKVEIKNGEAKADKEFAQADKKIKEAEDTLASKKKEFEAGKAEAEKQLEEAMGYLTDLQTKLATANQGLDTINQAIIQAQKGKKDLETALLQLKTALENATTEQEKQVLQEQINQTKASITKVETTLAGLNQKKEETAAGITTLKENITKIQEQIQTGKAEISKNEQLIKQAETELITQKNTLAQTKKTTYAKLESSKRQVANGETELAENEKKLEDARNEADEKIKEAEEKLQQAKDDLKEIKKPDWYILDRESNPGYVSYKQDTQRIANIGKVFPIVFFVVAALISLTSMTRMVEEQRVQIGGLKALGYNKIQIEGKYINYAFLATVLGSIIGMTIGFYFLPAIIIDMYGMMYTIPETIISFNWYYGILGLGIATACTCGATIYACINELKETPASLMRPKSPKMGKRVFLEKIPFIWSRLKFSQKVTVRNLFRYKKRFLMTIIGICGCTSLIVAGFGLRDSISYMIPSQYGEIFKYNVQINLKDDFTRDEINQKVEELSKREEITRLLKTNMQSIEVNESTQSVQLIIPENVEELDNFISLKSRTKEERYTLDDNHIIITERLANLLNIKVGDTIRIKNTDEVVKEVTVGNITENYLLHYIYMSPKLYQDTFDEIPKYNVLLGISNNLDEKSEEAMAKDILEQDEISSVTLTSTAENLFDDVMNNLDFVVWVLIISAGLLAFVVLYNLSNVNISERIRELATIKVLGFYDKEVYNYITRETVLLTIIGIALGLFAGYFLNLFIIQTCELDMLMFDKVVKPTSYLYAIAITVIFTLIVNFATYFTLKKIDMIESLKSVE